jgi:DNA polymerase-3 subunit delta'
MFIGNKRAVKTLKQSIMKKQFAQAYIFSGPDQVGKRTLAEKFAVALVTGKPFEEINDELILRAYPDTLKLYPEKEEKRGVVKTKNVSLESVREAMGKLSQYPYAGNYRVLIIDEAEKMKSQHALLKTLEEPNSTSIVILLTANISKILPTIRSRCRQIVFTLVDEVELVRALTGRGSGNSQEISSLAMGRPGVAIRCIEDESFLERLRETREIFQNFSQLTTSERLKIGEGMARNVPQGIQKLQLLLWLEQSGGEKASAEKLKTIQKGIDLLSSTNANPRLAIENTLISL